MSSSLPPQSNPTETASPPQQSASPPTSDDIVPPPTPIIIPIQIPSPSLSPPSPVPPLSASPSPLLALPPLLPLVVPTSPPPAALPPLSPPLLPLLSPPPQPQPQPHPQPQPQPQPLPQPQPQPQLQPQPQPPIIPPIKHIPPPTFTTPPNISPPPPLPLKTTTPPNILPPPRKTTTSPNITPPVPKMTTPTQIISPPPAPLLTRRQKHVPTTTEPKMPAVRQTKSGPTNNSSKATPIAASAVLPTEPPVAASSVLPTEPPVALPVPQTPGGGAWFPDVSAPASIMPSIPGVLNSPPSGGIQEGQVSQVVSEPKSGGSSGSAVGLVVGGVLLLVLGVLFGIFVVLCRRRKKNRFGDDGETKMHASSYREFQDKNSLPRYTKKGPKTPGYQIPVNATTSQAHVPVVAGLAPGVVTHLSSGTFTYEELAAATSGFSDKNLLGQGGFGYVHKGVLPNGKEVAVKQLRMGGDQGEREFRAEVDTISQVHHKHLVSLVGYCISGPERLLVYEFVANDTLEFHLHGKEQPVMDWPTRLKIAIGSAKGLAYLHEDCSPSIIHRDIKAANILLDFNFEAKVSDFGLAKIFSNTNPSVTHMTTRVVGTFGYLAPEYASSGKVTDKSDIYSYGVVLLELITGRPPISNFGPATNGSLVNWARPLLAQAIADGNFDALADPRLQHNYNVDEMVSMVSCAAACVRLSSWRRPRMSQVIRALEGNLSASELDDGVKAGHSPMQFQYESLDFDARDYIDDMKRMALARRYSDNTSDYGLNNPSISSTDTTQLIG